MGLRPTHGDESALLRFIDSKQVTRDFRGSAIAFHEEPGPSQVGSFRWTRFFLPPSCHCRHPSIRSLSERFCFRSVQVGCSRFSRCCHLIIDLGFISKMKAGPGD